MRHAAKLSYQVRHETSQTVGKKYLTDHLRLYNTIEADRLETGIVALQRLSNLLRTDEVQGQEVVGAADHAAPTLFSRRKGRANRDLPPFKPIGSAC